VLQDRYGQDLTTRSSAARNAYVRGVDRLLSADAGADAAFREAIAADHGFALAHIALARTLQIMGRGPEVKAPLECARALAAGTSPREQSHLAIFERILTGQGAAALQLIPEHLKQWPRDAMTLAPATSVFGLIAFSGRAGREVEQLAMLEPLATHYGDDWWFRTVLGFAQIELQMHEPGLRNIEAALAARPRSANSAHIRAHAYYEMGEREAGLAFLGNWAKDYPREGQLHCHVSWHLAVWSMETGRREEAWRIYHDAMRPGAAWGPQINVLSDCASFLVRAEIAGEPRRPELWRDIADYAAKWFPNSGVTFADVHSALAFAMAGDGDALGQIARAPKGPAADILAPIARGFGAFARGDWDGTLREIEPLLATHERIGGSRAQRDLLEYTAACALLRAGRADAARHLIATRRPQNGKPAFPVAGLPAQA
jgi:hypothetical protein